MEKEFDIFQLTLHPQNPREMSEFMEGKLIESILVFPQMLQLRPILVNKSNVVVGGNQRVSCLQQIARLDDNEIEDYLFNQKKFRLMSEEGKVELINYWKEWKKKPVVPARVLTNLTESEEKELLVKDNIHYGEDDIDALKQHFDRESYSDYFGSVPWNLYDYNDKINDQGLEMPTKFPEKFKCGYVECQLTDREFNDICALFERYLEEHEGVGDGFLTLLLLEQ